MHHSLQTSNPHHNVIPRNGVERETACGLQGAAVMRKMRSCVFKARNCVLRTRNCVLKTRNCVFKMMNLSVPEHGRLLGIPGGAPARDGALRPLDRNRSYLSRCPPTVIYKQAPATWLQIWVPNSFQTWRMSLRDWLWLERTIQKVRRGRRGLRAGCDAGGAALCAVGRAGE